MCALYRLTLPAEWRICTTSLPRSSIGGLAAPACSPLHFGWFSPCIARLACFVGGTSDLKSHNLLVSKKDGTVKLCDFGLVHTKHTTAGTPAYMAPELLNDKPFSKKCDVYAFGVLLWEVGRHRRLLVPPTPHHDGRWC